MPHDEVFPAAIAHDRLRTLSANTDRQSSITNVMQTHCAIHAVVEVKASQDSRRRVRPRRPTLSRAAPADGRVESTRFSRRTRRNLSPFIPTPDRLKELEDQDDRDDRSA